VKINDNCTQTKRLHTHTNTQYQISQNNTIRPTDKHTGRYALLQATRRVAPSSSKRRFIETCCLHYYGSNRVPLERVRITARQHGVNVSETPDNQSMTTKLTKLNKTDALRHALLNRDA